MVGGGSESDCHQNNHQHSNQGHFRQSESCPAPNHSTSESGESTPEPGNQTKFWKRKPLDLLNMVHGHFTVEDDGSSPWEVVPNSESPFPETPDLPLPELIGTSEIMTDEHRRQLSKHLPARAEGYTWDLQYSTSKHGFSLKTLYREMTKTESPILIVIEDTLGSVFGALTSCPLKTSDLFYGTGESFLFSFTPEFQIFTWSGDNQYFIKGNPDSLAIGAGDGSFGLWLDGDLCHGRSQPCHTFDNPRLSKEEDFVVKTLECWGFV